MNWIYLAVCVVSNLLFSRVDGQDQLAINTISDTKISLNVTPVTPEPYIPHLPDINNVLSRRKREAPVRPFSAERTLESGPLFDYKTNFLSLRPNSDPIVSLRREMDGQFLMEGGGRIGPAGSPGGPVHSGPGIPGRGIGKNYRRRDNLKSRCTKNNQAAVCQNKRKELSRRRYGDPGDN